MAFLSDQQTVLGVLHDLAINRPFLLFALLAGLYLMRRLVDQVHDRTGWRVMGLAASLLIESFFLLMLSSDGAGAHGRSQTFGRVAARTGAVRPVAGRRSRHRLAEFFSIFAIGRPSSLTTLAELWRKGQPYAARVPGASIVARYSDKRASAASDRRRRA